MRERVRQSRAQARVITLNDDEALINYAKPIVAELRANRVRVDADFSATPFKAKIANAEQLRVHTMLVIGGRDMEAGAVSVRLHHGGPQADEALMRATIHERFLIRSPRLIIELWRCHHAAPWLRHTVATTFP